MAKPGKVRVVTGDNRTGYVDADKLAAAKAKGWREATEKEAKQKQLRREASGVVGTVQGGFEAVAAGASLGATDLALDAIGVKGVGARRENLAEAGTALEAAGGLAAAVATGGGAGAAQIAGRGGAALGRRALARRGLGLLAAPTKYASRAGVAVERAVLGGVEGAEASIGRRVLASAAGGATEGGIAGFGGVVSESVIKDKPVTAEALVGGVLAGAAFDGALSGGVTGAGGAMGRVLRGMHPKRGDVVTDESLREVLGDSLGVKPSEVSDAAVAAARKPAAGEAVQEAGDAAGTDPEFVRRFAAHEEADPQWVADTVARQPEIEAEIAGSFSEGFERARSANVTARQVADSSTLHDLGHRLPRNADFVAPRLTEQLRSSIATRLDDLGRRVDLPSIAAARALPARVLEESKGGAQASFQAMARMRGELAERIRETGGWSGTIDDPAMAEANGELRTIFDDVSKHLEREDLWGAAGPAQREVNAAFMTAAQAEASIGNAAPGLFGPDGQIDPRQALRIAREAGRTESDQAMGGIEAALEAQANYLRTVARHHDLSPEQAAQLAQAEAAITSTRERFSSQARSAGLLDDVSQIRESGGGGIGGGGGDVPPAAGGAGGAGGGDGGSELGPEQLAKIDGWARRYGKFFGGDEEKFSKLGRLLTTERGRRLMLSNLDEVREASAVAITKAAAEANDALDLAVREAGTGKLKRIEEMLEELDKPKRGDGGKFAAGQRRGKKPRTHALEHLRKHAADIEEALGDELAPPPLIADLKKAQRLVARALEQAEAIKKPSEAFRAIDTLKRELDVISIGRANEYKRNASPETLEASNAIRKMAGDSRKHLESAEIYGPAGEMQKTLNGAIRREMEAARELKRQSPALAKMLEKGATPDTNAALNLARMWGRTKGTSKVEAFEELVDARLDYLRTAREQLDLSPEVASKLEAAERSAGEMRKQMAEQAEVADAADVMQHARAIEGGGSPSITMLSTAGPAIGAAAGMGLGGLPGAIVGTMAGSITRPYTTARSMAALLSLSKRYGKRFDGGSIVAKLRKGYASAGAKVSDAGRRGAAAARRGVERASGPARSLARGLRLQAAFALGKLSAEDKAKGLEKLSAHLAELADPEKLERQLGPEFEVFAGEAPDTAAAVRETMARLVGFLRSNLPKIHTDPFSGRPPLVNGAEADRYLRLAAAAINPRGVVNSLLEGTITTDEARALREVYPLTYQQLRDGVAAAVQSAAQGGEPIPFNGRVRLSILLGQPLDPLMDPRAIARLQALYVATPSVEAAEASAAGPSRGRGIKTTGELGALASGGTGSERTATRRTS